MKDYKFSTNDIADFSEGTKKKILPDGSYLVGVVDMKMVPYKALEGEYLNITFEVCQDDEHDGYRLYENFNLFHPTKPKAVGFSKYKFAELVKSTGLDLEKFSNFSELLDKTTRVKVSTESSKEWGDKNKIDRFMSNLSQKVNGSKGDSKFADDVYSTDIPW